VERCDSLALDGDDQGTIAIFDETGCIPSFEMLGLSRLGCSIDVLLVVGDIHQHAPYNPDETGKPQSKRSRAKKHKERKFKNLNNILDESNVTVVKLTTQYRTLTFFASIQRKGISYFLYLKRVPLGPYSQYKNQQREIQIQLKHFPALTNQCYRG
jgi:hypothetical protein